MSVEVLVCRRAGGHLSRHSATRSFVGNSEPGLFDGSFSHSATAADQMSTVFIVPVLPSTAVRYVTND